MPTLKHGAHLVNLAIPNQTVATTTVADEFPYHAAGWVGRWAYDGTQELLTAGALVVQAGTFTNWATLTLKHFNSAGATVDSLNLTVLAPVANQNIDITGTAAASGNTLMTGWTLNPGDSFELLGTSGASVPAPAVSVTLVLEQLHS